MVGAGPQRRNSLASFARVQQLANSETQMQEPISPRRTKSAQRLPRPRKPDEKVSPSPIRKRLGDGLGRTAVSAKRMAAVGKAIEAPETVRRAEMIGTGATKVVVRHVRSTTRTAGSLPQIGAGARAVLHRLLGPPGPLRRGAELREPLRMPQGRRVLTLRPHLTLMEAKKMLRGAPATVCQEARHSRVAVVVVPHRQLRKTS